MTVLSSVADRLCVRGACRVVSIVILNGGCVDKLRVRLCRVQRFNVLLESFY